MASGSNASVSQNDDSDSISSSTSTNFTSLAKTLHFNLPIKLDVGNYVYWKAQVMPAIRALELVDLISGSKSPPPKVVEVISADGQQKEIVENKAYTAWMKADQILLCWLLSTISQSVLGQVTSWSTSFEVWNTLESLYSQKSLAIVFQLQQQLQNIKKGSSSISDFILKVKTTGDDLRAANQVVTDYDLIFSIMNGVGHEYDPVVALISSQQKSTTLQDVQCLLMIHEQRIQQLNSVAQFDVSAMNHSGNFVSGNQEDKRFQRSFSNGNRGRSKRGRGRGWSNGGRWNHKPSCQICGKAGHIALQCYGRYDKNVQRHAQCYPNSSPHYNQVMQGGGFQSFGQQQPQQTNMIQSSAYFATPESL